ncbi:MAG: hypothetical protein H0T55_01975 [Rubrobacteraceae bacterium]|nr:hypothetical protein [Rubrobacteraceae bacterium]MDQ3637418.1 hypothetical protein [Actinomycetota bacterium]
MSARTAARLAWSLWALSVALTGLSLLLLVLILRYPNSYIFDWWLGNALVVVDATVGAIVASRRPENPVGWLLCLSGVVVGTSSFTSQYAIYTLLARPGSLPAGEASAWVAAWMLPIMIGLQVSYILLFPTGRLPGRRWRWLAWLTVVFVLVGMLTFAFSPGAYQGSLGPIKNPLGIEGFDIFYQAVLYTMAPLLFGTAALSVYVRLRQARGVERQQIKWFAYAAAIYAVSIVLNVINLAIDAPLWFERGSTAIFTVAGMTIPISIGIAILSYRLYDIDRIINRTLVYGSLTVTLVSLYFGGIVLLQRVFDLLTGAGEKSTLAVVASTLVIAALFNPLRRRVQGFVDRRFYRYKYDAAKTLEAFGSRLRDETDLEALSNDLVGVVRGTMQPEHVTLWLRPDPEPEAKNAALRQFGHEE